MRDDGTWPDRGHTFTGRPSARPASERAGAHLIGEGDLLNHEARGSHRATAVYGGDASYLASTSAVLAQRVK